MLLLSNLTDKEIFSLVGGIELELLLDFWVLNVIEEDRELHLIEFTVEIAELFKIGSDLEWGWDGFFQRRIFHIQFKEIFCVVAHKLGELRD